MKFVSFLHLALNSTIYNSAAAYFPMDSSSAWLNFKIYQEMNSSDSFGYDLGAVGPVNGAALFDRSSVFIDPLEVSCLAEPHFCTQGFTLAFWINILEVYHHKAVILRRARFKETSLAGVKLKVLTLGTRKIFEILVTSFDKSCVIRFRLNFATWFHVAFTWRDGIEMRLFLNGVRKFPFELEKSSCGYDGGPVTTPLKKSVFLGSREIVMLMDDVVLWNKQLNFNEVQGIYDKVIGGKRSIVVVSER